MSPSRRHLLTTITTLAAGTAVAALPGVHPVPATPVPVPPPSPSPKPDSADATAPAISAQDAAASTPSAIDPAVLVRMGVNVLDYAPADPKGDWTDAFQRAIDLAATFYRRVIVPQGTYAIRSLHLRSRVKIVGVASDNADYGGSGTQAGGVTLDRIDDGSSTGMLVIDGPGVTLENLVLRGQGVAAPLIHMLNGFNSRLDTVRLTDCATTALLVEQVDNNDWEDVFVTNSGSTDAAAVIIRSPQQPDPSQHVTNTNSVTAVNCTISDSANVALDIAWGSTGEHFVEFVRLIGLHVETIATGRASDATIRIGNVRSVQFTDAFVYGAPGRPLIEYHQQRMNTTLAGGVHFVGGTLLGANTDRWPTARTPVLVKASRGNDLALTAVRLGQFSEAAVSLGSAFGPQVVVDEATYAVGLAPDGKGGWKQDLAVPIIADGRTGQRASVKAGSGNPGGSVSLDGDAERGVIVFDTGPDAVAGSQVYFKYGVPAPGQPVITLTPLSSSAATSSYFAYPTDQGFLLSFGATPIRDTKNGAYRFAYRVDRLRR